MERLTFDGKFCDIAQCTEIPGGSFCENGTCRQKEVWLRLKDYENTGLTPVEVRSLWGEWNDMMRVLNSIGWGYARLRELAKADKEGRVVVLPCKVGDTVWIAGSVIGVYSVKVRTFFVGHPSAARGTDGDGGIQMIRTTICDVPIKDFGKTVFLTREEAERALQEMEGKA